MRPRLPQDILDMIIDEARDDRVSLKACSRTSSLLLHRSRTHLHRVFTLEHVDCSLLSSVQSRKLAELSQLPAIVDYADEFRLVTARHKRTCESGKDLAAAFWSTIGRFKHVRTLQLVGLDWTRGPPTALQDKVALSRAFPAVRDLGIVGSIFADKDEVLALMSYFPLLTHLRFADAADTASSFDPVATVPDPHGRIVLLEPSPSLCSILTRPNITISTPTLRSIHLIACHSGHFGIATARSLLQASSQAEQVQSLAVTLLLNKEDPSGSFSLVPLISRSLLDLHVIAQQHDSLAAMYPKFDAIRRDTVRLNECSNLRALRLSLRRNIKSQMAELLHNGRSSIWDAYIPILSNIRSDKIHQIAFDVEPLDIECGGLDKLQDRLCSSPFLGIKDIRFNVICDRHNTVFMSPRLALLWKTGFSRLKSHHTVQLVVCEKEDVDPLFLPPKTSW